ncbi:precorrin-6y C5,15-methyltransferase (decarboxylating) subunit CbiE, partial [Streptomyces sp. SID10692]|uniref:precorrin-6y C5,15-methyltransferase (decarboxylating) subunit CbiE n=2 Tax=Streptomyces TaxID=1883 RepID=UPI0013D90338|nr:precorrin-6y C5,15-methyltransferase (decarboxylating) subunit CbiE [Streptomyces sp. SID10692]
MADRVTVIGWDGSPLTRAATAALSGATLVAGAAHHLALPEVPPNAERVRLGSVDLAARRIAGHRGSAVVLADGDPGFFGVVRTLRAREHGLEVEVVPAVSSVATAFARAGMPWDDAQIVVAHPRTLRRAVNVCRAHHKVAVLTSPGAGPAELALLLDGIHRTFVICEELGTARERVTVLTSDKAADHAWRDPNVVIVVGSGPETAAAGGWIAGRMPAYPQGIRGWALPADAYRAAGAERMQESGEGEFPGLRAAQL